MSSIDERVVKMQFDNAAFKKGAVETQKSLSDLNKAVDASGKSKGLLNLESQMGSVAVAASKMQIVTTTALATIANKAVNAGITVAKSLTFDPLKSGFTEYEALLTKQNVIMNATGKSGEYVKNILKQLNTYSDKTIYSFGDMTDSITKFVNAGVELPTAVTSIKGIANAAAFAGANSTEAGRAMYAFSQSMQTGYIMLQDWMQIENANMGTITFKNTLLDAAVAAGTLKKQGDGFVTASGKYVSATEGWRDGLQEQWATTEVLNKALEKYADTNTDLGKKAFDSATKVRTFTAFMDTLKESLGSGWASIFRNMIGGLDEATNFWTGLSNTVGGAVKDIFHFLSVTTKTFKRLGGMENLMQVLQNVLAPFAAILETVGKAWNDAFPHPRHGAGRNLYLLSEALVWITTPLQWLADLIRLTTPGLTVFFRVLGKGASIIGYIAGLTVGFVKDLLDLADLDVPKSGGFLGFLQAVGEAIADAIDGLDDLLSRAGSLGGLFAGASIDLPGIGGASSAAGAVEGAAKDQASAMSRIMRGLSSVAGKMAGIFSAMWSKLKSFLSDFTVEDLVVIFNQALFTAFAINIIRITNALTKAFSAFSEIGQGVGDVLSGAGAGLKSFQTAAQAKLVLNLAIAIGVLAASLWLLSKIPKDELAAAMAAMATMMFLLNRSMGAFTKTVTTLTRQGATANTLALSVAVVALAVAMAVLAAALLIMNKVEWKSIAKGLTTMFVMLKLLEQLGNLDKRAAANLLGASVAMLAVAGAMTVLAGALLLFALVDWESIGKGGAVLAGMTGAIAGLAMIPYEGIAKVGLAMLGASVGFLLMANALIMFGLVKWESIGKAAVVMTMLAVALGLLMAEGGPIPVAAMIGLAGAMLILAAACMVFNNVEWASIAKATVVLTALLLALAVGATILAAFLYVIAPVAPVLVGLGGAFALLGVGLLAFAGAMAIAMSVGMAGVAVFAALATGAATAIAVFLQTLALQAPVIKESVLAILQSFIDGVVESIPMIIQGFKDAWEAIKAEMSSEDKKKSFGEIAQEWFDKLLEVVRKNGPRIQRTFVELVLSLLHALARRADEFAQVGTEFVVGLIKGFGARNEQIVKAAVAAVIKFADGLRKEVKTLTDAGIDLIAAFLHDLADSIREGSGDIGDGIKDVVDAFFDVGVDMIQGLINGITSVDIKSVVEDLASNLPGWARKVLEIESPSKVFRDIGKFISQGLTLGIQDHAAAAIKAVASMVSGQIAVANQLVSGYIQKLDQQAIAARARADGMLRAANQAAEAADKTKTKSDDHSAQEMTRAARRADRKADAAERKARRAEQKQDRKETWEEASASERAEIRSQDAQRSLEAAKAAERRAASNLAEADALERASKAEGVTQKQREEFQRKAERLRKEAREEARRANELLESARDSAASALVWQQRAGAEAAESFQEQFDAQARADAEAEAFDKLSDEEKAKKLREQAAQKQKDADLMLAMAKNLAFTDIKKANEVAQQAMDAAAEARDLLDQAEALEANNGPGLTPIDFTQTAQAAADAQRYKEQYDSAYAAAAGTSEVTFNQYNQSPESLSTGEIYRRTQNQISYAAAKLGVAS